MEIVKSIFTLVIEIVVGVILIGAFSQVFVGLGIPQYIPILWIFFILAAIGSFVAILKFFD